MAPSGRRSSKTSSISLPTTAAELEALLKQRVAEAIAQHEANHAEGSRGSEQGGSGQAGAGHEGINLGGSGQGGSGQAGVGRDGTGPIGTGQGGSGTAGGTTGYLLLPYLTQFLLCSHI